jgi:hypothetical protein
MSSKENPLKVITVEEKQICVGGIGKMFFEHGLPISITIDQLSKNDIGFNLLNLVDEFIKNGWEEKTIISKISEELDSLVSKTDIDNIQNFIKSDYEDQREMIFKSLFNTSSEDAKTNPSKFKSFLKNEK